MVITKIRQALKIRVGCVSENTGIYFFLVGLIDIGKVKQFIG
jgi:hypothetical protein